MDIFEYNEVRWPTRALQQEEEEQAAATSEACLQPPEIQWDASSPSPTPAQLLVVATSPASSILLESCLSQKAVGRVVMHVPAATTSAQGSLQEQQQQQQVAAAPLYAPAAGVLVCCCNPAVAPERAPAWARAILQQLKPQQVLLLGSMQAEQYRGDADASQELLAFCLCTTAARQQHQAGTAPVAPYLPSGSIVAGLPAAVLTQAELAGLPAELLVVVEQVPSLVPETLQQLSGLVNRALQQSLAAAAAAQQDAPAGHEWVGQVTQEGVVAAARAQLQRTAYRPSSVYS